MSRRLIVVKGLLFLSLAVVTAGLVYAEARSARMAALLAILVWSACRFYYFLFYALEKYVNPERRYSGTRALAAEIIRRQVEGRFGRP